MEEDYHEEKKKRGRGRSRGRPKGKQKTKGLKLTRGNKIESDDDDDAEIPMELPAKPVVEKFDEDCDISSLQAPTFSTLLKGPSGPMKDLTWDHPVNLIGEKVLSPRIHCCDLCHKPILIYGRMIPCKHVFCLTCAKTEEKACPRCSDKVARVEQTGLGTVFMCNFSIGDSPCKRTYLSQRDLQAHIAHRHVKSSTSNAVREEPQEVTHRDPGADYRSATTRPDPRSGANVCDPRVGSGKEGYEARESYQQQQHHGGGQYHGSGRSFSHSHAHAPATTSAAATASSVVSHHIPVMTSSRTNLITVPLQDQQDQFPSPPPKITSHPPPQLTLPPPSFSTPPPHYPTTSYVASPYSTAPPQFTYAPTPLHRPPGPPPFSTSHPPVPVPPPPPNSYGSQYGPRQWSGQAPAAPPPAHPISHPPPGPPPPHHPPPATTAVSYYR